MQEKKIDKSVYKSGNAVDRSIESQQDISRKKYKGKCYQEN